ncbi:MAG: hypothetical protein MZV64_19320 [Ignavibacteriales bacterium]|nr:hypothetical protein [Ignavibacteriales bacterium]
MRVSQSPIITSPDGGLQQPVEVTHEGCLPCAVLTRQWRPAPQVQWSKKCRATPASGGVGEVEVLDLDSHFDSLLSLGDERAGR